MERAIASGKVYRFGLFEADPANNTLTRKGVRIKIQDQPFRVLILLLERAGEVISRDEMRQKLWPEGTYVDFDGSLNVILKKLRAALEDDSENPRFVETVPRRGYRLIAPVSVSVTQTAPVPEDIPEPIQTQAIVPEPRAGEAHRHPHLLIYGSAALAVILAATLIFAWRWRHRDSTQSAAAQVSAPIPIRKSLAVLGFNNTSGRTTDAWLATAFSEMLSTELAAGEKLRLVSGEDVANLRLSSPWSPTDSLDRATTSRVGAALNSDLLVLGSYAIVGSPKGGRLRIDVRMQDAKTGEILTEMAEIGGSEDIFQVVSRVGDKLRDRLGIPSLEPSDEASLLASAPLDPESARFYALGVSKAREFDWLASKDLLEQSVKIDPKYPLVHLELAVAWARLGYEQKRKEEARKAFDLSSGLPSAQRLLIEGNYYESLADHERAASTYRALFQLFPDSVDYGLLLATAQIGGGLAAQASHTLTQLRSLPAPARDDPRIDLLDIRATAQNDPDRLVLIRRSVKAANAQGKKLLYAQARKAECLNLIYSEHPDQSVPVCQEAYDIFMAAGNHLEAADAIRLMGDYEGSQGKIEQAIATYQRALRLLSELGEHNKTAAVLNNMAVDYANEGKLDEAERLYRQAKAHFEQAGDKEMTALTLGNIADVFYLRGDLAGASSMYREALQLQELQEHVSTGYILYRLADLELTQGHPQDARREAEKAVEDCRRNKGAFQYLTGAMIVLGEVMEAQGDLPGARRVFEETLSIRQKTGEADLVGESQVELASLSLEDGHRDQAEPLLRAAITQFENDKSLPEAASAYVVLSRALLLDGKVEPARQAIDRAKELGVSDSSPASKMEITIQTARVETAEGSQFPGPKSRAAEQELHAALATAKKTGFYTIECEGRLALGELSARLNPANGRSELTALASTARSRGFELVARRAEQAATSAGTAVATAKPAPQ